LTCASLLNETTTVAAIDAQYSHYSVPRLWAHTLLCLIRVDFAKPVVHARNLYTMSLLMASVNNGCSGSTTVLGPGINEATMAELANIGSVRAPHEPYDDRADSCVRCASAAAGTNMLLQRFSETKAAMPERAQLIVGLVQDRLATHQCVDADEAWAAGTELASLLCEDMKDDGCREDEGYDYEEGSYVEVNPRLEMNAHGNPDLLYPNRWQRLRLSSFTDQSSTPYAEYPPFVGPHWGHVRPFALSEADCSVDVYAQGRPDLPVYGEDDELHFGHGDGDSDGESRRKRSPDSLWHALAAKREDVNTSACPDGVYLDPGPPPHIEAGTDDVTNPDTEGYRSNFTAVLEYSSHLDPYDGVVMDVSPASRGASTFGTNDGRGYGMNPHTGRPYKPQWVARGDYTRVLAEFWADGPQSETPPGHWHSIMHHAMDDPTFVRRWRGRGPILPANEYDAHAHLALSGAMHDAAIAAWGVKSWYDFVRPVSAIRWMADKGQSSDPQGLQYDPMGLPLIPGFIELVTANDTKVGGRMENLVPDYVLPDRRDGFAEFNLVQRVAVRAWLGPTAVPNPEEDVAGVNWVLARDWWPYQRPSFVTPPFAGYVSGHSTFSRAAAEVLTHVTGSAYFPGGLGEYTAEQDTFLEFERGPSRTFSLQWARYSDAADETSLSRIWGGIHPPADDVPGRFMGAIVADRAVRRVEELRELDERWDGSVGQRWRVRVGADDPIVRTHLPTEALDAFRAEALAMLDDANQTEPEVVLRWLEPERERSALDVYVYWLAPAEDLLDLSVTAGHKASLRQLVLQHLLDGRSEQAVETIESIEAGMPPVSTDLDDDDAAVARNEAVHCDTVEYVYTRWCGGPGVDRCPNACALGRFACQPDATLDASGAPVCACGEGWSPDSLLGCVQDQVPTPAPPPVDPTEPVTQDPTSTATWTIVVLATLAALLVIAAIVKAGYSAGRCDHGAGPRQEDGEVGAALTEVQGRTRRSASATTSSAASRRTGASRGKVAP
jgi:hypothetical protein